MKTNLKRFSKDIYKFGFWGIFMKYCIMKKKFFDTDLGFTPATPNNGDGGRPCSGSDFEGL